MSNQTLYLCEKPSQARDIAAILGKPQSAKQSIQTEQGIVTWAFGHILELAMPDEYDPALKQWRMDNLPIFPDHFIIKPRSDAAEQLAAIGGLLDKAMEVVIATDADREGEMIAREILDHFKYKKRVNRLWLSALDPESIRKALARMRSGAETEPLYHSALARSRADWLFGINMTRALTIKTRTPGGKTLISIGRVQTPTLALVVKRDREIENFKPQTYFDIFAHTGTRDAQGAAAMVILKLQTEEKITNPVLADSIVKKIDGFTGPLAVVKTAERPPPPPLFSLSGLQKTANARYGWGADKTLQTAQALYETHKAATYPRTDCEFLPEEQIADVSRIVANLSKIPYFAKHIPIAGKLEPRKRVFDTKKITAHHAIIPTTLEANLSRMSDDERKLYLLVAARYLASLCPDYEYLKTKITMNANGHNLAATGHAPVKPGWKAIYDEGEEKKKDDGAEDEDSDRKLPAINNGEPGTISKVDLRKKETKPPPRYTEGRLIDDMKKIAKFVEDPVKKAKLKETSGIGTEATRANIISVLKQRTFLEVKGRTIISTPLGRFTIETLERCLPSLIDPGETAVWEERLEGIASGAARLDDFITSIKGVIMEHLHTLSLTVLGQSSAASEAESIGPCPECGAAVVEREKFFRCSKQLYKDGQLTGCPFIFWKSSKILKSSLRTSSMAKLLKNQPAQLTVLMKNGESKQLCLIEKRTDYTGKPFWGFKFQSNNPAVR